MVIGRFVTQQVNQTVRITLEGGETLEGTAVHPIWSVDREDWVPMGDMREGELLLGKDGPIAINVIEFLSSPVPVYNLEVHGEHVYQVTIMGVLVHNVGKPCDVVVDGVPNNEPRNFFGKGKTVTPPVLPHPTSKSIGKSPLARLKGERMKSTDSALQQLEELKQAQRKVRQGKLNKLIDSTKKSEQRLNNRFKEIRNLSDLESFE